MKASEIIDMSMEQFNRLNEKELQQALRAMQKAVNQRTNRMKKSGEYSSAVQALEKSGGQISAKRASRAEMQNELQRGIEFMKMRTGTVRGARIARIRHQQKLEEMGLPGDVSQEQLSAAWEDYNRLKEDFNAEILEQMYGSKYSEAAQNIVKRLAEGESIDALRSELQEAYQNFMNDKQTELDRITNGL